MKEKEYKLEERVCYFVIHQIDRQTKHLVSTKVINQVKTQLNQELKNQVSFQAWNSIRHKIRSHEKFRF